MVSRLLLTLDAMRISNELLYSAGVLLVAIVWVIEAAWIWLINKLLVAAYNSSSQQSTNLCFIFIFHLSAAVFFVFTFDYSGQDSIYWFVIVLLPFLVGTAYLLVRLFNLLSRIANK